MAEKKITGETFTPKGDGAHVRFGDDLPYKSKDTLAKYLSKRTTDPQDGNTYPIDPDNPITDISLRQANGLPSEFVTGGSDKTEGFTRRIKERDDSTRGAAAAVTLFKEASDSRIFSPVLNTYFNKNSQQAGNYLLDDFKSTRDAFEPGVGDTTGKVAFDDPKDAPDIQKKISQILRTSNRFDPMPSSSPYIQGNKFSSPGIPVEQGKLGVWLPTEDRTSIEELGKIAYSQLLRSTGHNLKGLKDPTSKANRKAIKATNKVQRGAKKVDTFKLRAKEQYKAPDRLELPNGHIIYSDIDGKPLPARKSYGVLNNPYEPFHSGEWGPMEAQLRTAAAAFGEIAAGAAVFGILFTLVQTAALSVTIPKDPSKMRKGQYQKVKKGATASLLKALGIPLTRKPIGLCIIYGIFAFFKIDDSAIPTIPGVDKDDDEAIEKAWLLIVAALGTAFDALINVQQSHGYYATILRTVRRDLEELGVKLKKTPSDPTKLLQLLMTINTYASWRFFISLAIMGDRYLAARDRPNTLVKSINKMPNNGTTRIAKSRANNSSPMLAWRHRASPSLLLLPKKYATGMQLWGFTGGYAEKQFQKIGDAAINSPGQPTNKDFEIDGKKANLGPKTQRRMVVEGSHRIPQNLVRKMEVELDCEYMPFYFHDLRTNEILSFHGFIEDVSDSYSVNYAESSGYGRIDPVKIYQSTSRSISCSWTMVATSKEDFDSMWFSINKMVSMIYPQFSMGKPVRAGTKKFIMPFSQIPTASPVIRLRVGDIIRSNYSRHDLGRLFGLDEGVAADPASAGMTVVDPATGKSADGRDFGSAPFDLTYDTKAQAEIAEAADDTTKKAKSAKDALEEQLSLEPTTATDEKYGYWPGSELTGRATLKANAEGYQTYDMDADLSAPSGGPGAFPAYKSKDWPSRFPPPTATSGTKVETTAFTSKTTAPGVVNIIARRVSDENGDFNGDAAGTASESTETSANKELKEGRYTEYLVSWVNPDEPADPYGPALKDKGHTHAYIVTSADLIPFDPPEEPPPEGASPDDVLISLEMQVLDIYRFFDPNSNAVVRSFESAGGQGLAGVITSFDMDWGEAQWDMSDISRRAPTMVKCSIAFSPIHDIVPGLDNNGAMRAINYPVGKISDGLGTDFHSANAGDHGGGTNRLRSTVAKTAKSPGGITEPSGLSRNRRKASHNKAWKKKE